jgi:hypothetical protein
MISIVLGDILAVVTTFFPSGGMRAQSRQWRFHVLSETVTRYVSGKQGGDTMNLVGPSTNPSLAFTNGLCGRDRDGNPFSVRIEQVGELLVTSGSLVACDPHFLYDAPLAYTTHVPSGRYPVLVSLPQSEGLCGGRVAFAQVQLNKQEAVQWEMAVLPGQDVSTLAPGHFFGYGVDSGTGCFLDEDVLAWILGQAGVHDLTRWRSREPPQSPEEAEVRMKLGQAVLNYLEETVSEPIWQLGVESGSLILNETTGGNIVTFISGYGDGCYPSYFLYAAEGSLTSLITDFGVLQDAEWDSPLS